MTVHITVHYLYPSCCTPLCSTFRVSACFMTVRFSHAGHCASLCSHSKFHIYIHLFQSLSDLCHTLVSIFLGHVFPGLVLGRSDSSDSVTCTCCIQCTVSSISSQTASLCILQHVERTCAKPQKRPEVNSHLLGIPSLQTSRSPQYRSAGQTAHGTTFGSCCSPILAFLQLK